jgi:hypothetical protein
MKRATPLPEDATFEEVQYRLCVLEKIHRGLESLERNGGIPHDEARRGSRNGSTTDLVGSGTR